MMHAVHLDPWGAQASRQKPGLPIRGPMWLETLPATEVKRMPGRLSVDCAGWCQSFKLVLRRLVREYRPMGSMARRKRNQGDSSDVGGSVRLAGITANGVDSKRLGSKERT